ncbi:hypothetical protein FOIG_10125 [Fusarium odoratissimum NRRL 54006]|uniref:Uncharacterized protein n=2 Tax=Fusarium oxysporum species complex TaxID=171631 RepID=X0JND3_FUSO5|nr:uncharacterized protein FOIG_10125 [Fusarium odoratissimum NRRL 54006]EXL97810.1 hypothetical protein FOIG_10125 [Fusarium odoratissimum NRRL 54006]TXB97453.1 hypothetical protein FocTR4_00011328 [Fusarium oxysporum f. sp. cubense]
MEQKAQTRLSGMSLERMREMGTYTLDQYFTELAKESLIQGYKEGVGAAAAAIGTQVLLLGVPLTLRVGAAICAGALGNEIVEVGAEKLREVMAGPNEHGQKDAQAHVEGISKFFLHPWEFGQDLEEDGVKNLFEYARS